MAILAGFGRIAASAAASLTLAGLPLRAAHAQATDAAAPAATPALGALCTDRPTKSNYACTVDAGHFQYEADVVNESTLKLDGVTTQTWIVVNPTLKYGLTPSIDVEANLSPYETVRTQGNSGVSRTVEGVSDLYLRLKDNLLTTAGGALQVTILPYVKAPTAPAGIGNGVVEGGTLLPVNYKLTGALTLTTVPEVDILKNAANGGRHLSTAQLVNLGVSLPLNLTLYGELWGDWNFDPAATIQQTSADVALAWGATPYLQFDIGANAGLNRQTPGLQAYVGISQKF